MPSVAAWILVPILGLPGQAGDPYGPVSMGASVLDSGWSPYGNRQIAGFDSSFADKDEQAPLNAGTGFFPSGGRWWLESDFVMAWIRGAHTPPLLTAAPSGLPDNPLAAVGAPGTSVLSGGNLANDGMRPGLRLAAGYWFTEEQTLGIQGSFLMVGTQADTVSAGGTQVVTPFIVSRPFVAQETGLPSAAPVNFPGAYQGGAVVSPKAGYLYGADAEARLSLAHWDRPDAAEYPDRRFRIDGTLGYQFLHYSDGVGVAQSTVVLPPLAVFGIDAIRSMERFTASNMFNGGSAGLAADWWAGRWHLVTAAKIGLGGLSRQASIAGESVVTVQGTPFNVPGAVLARTSNIGSYRSCSLAWVPQADFKVDYRLTERMILSLGYTVLVLPQVWRAGEQIDPVSLLDQDIVGTHPRFPDNRSTLWMQGITLGMRMDF